MTERSELAAWYWQQIDEAAGLCPDDPTGGERVQDLVSAAICCGLGAQPVPVGDGVSVLLHELVAPYRRQPGGLAERSEAERRRQLDRPVPQRFRAGGLR